MVDIIIAQVEGTILSRKIGKDSIAKALVNNKADNNKCLFLITGKIFFTYSYYFFVPFIYNISNYRESKDE